MERRIGSRCVAPVLVGLLLIGPIGCGDPYAGDFHYKPNPYATTVSAQINGSAGPVELLIAIQGVREVERDGQDTAVLYTRLRLENLADVPARFDPDSLALYSADLRRFGEPRTTPSAPVTLEPDDSTEVVARFPFPDGLTPDKLDMSGLSLRWAVKIGEETLTRNTTFTRIWYPRYRRYSGYYWGDYYGPGRGGLYYYNRGYPFRDW